jgi:hypothetical protein
LVELDAILREASQSLADGTNELNRHKHVKRNYLVLTITLDRVEVGLTGIERRATVMKDDCKYLAKRHVFRFVFCAVAFGISMSLIPSGTNATECAETARTFEDRIAESLCTCDPLTSCTECLEPIEINACRRGCPRRGYAINVEDNVLEPPAPQYNPRLNLHITFNAFLKDLRDAATACRSEIIQTSSFGEITLGDLLWEEGEMVLRHPQVRYYNAALAPLSLAQVKTPGKNTIDPTKFYSVTWVNEGERAHAMTQADMGSWFLTTATSFAWYDRPANVPYYLYLARAAFRPFAIRSNLGGVRNNKGRYNTTPTYIAL